MRSKRGAEPKKKGPKERKESQLGSTGLLTLTDPKITFVDPLTIQGPKFKPKSNRFGHPAVQARFNLGTRHIQMYSPKTVEPATCTCQAVFIFMDTTWLSRPSARDDSVYFHRHISNISQTRLFIYLFIYSFIIILICE
jgi:hypothetical protein